MNGGVLQLILTSAWPTKAVLLVLAGFSVATWTVIFHKWRAFASLRDANAGFRAAYGACGDTNALEQTANIAPKQGLGMVFRDGMEKVRRRGAEPYTVDWLASIERRLKGSQREEITRQEQYLSVLATTSNVAPFIGLLGTVWGIITAFREIAAQGSASIAAVAPGVAEALVATAAGLFAAIPAVVAFNFFISRVRADAAELESFSLEFIDLLHDLGPRADLGPHGDLETRGDLGLRDD